MDTYAKGLQSALRKQVVVDYPIGVDASARDLYVDISNAIYLPFSKLKLHADSGVYTGISFSSDEFNALANATLPRIFGLAYSTAVIPLADRA